MPGKVCEILKYRGHLHAVDTDLATVAVQVSQYDLAGFGVGKEKHAVPGLQNIEIGDHLIEVVAIQSSRDMNNSFIFCVEHQLSVFVAKVRKA